MHGELAGADRVETEMPYDDILGALRNLIQG
jgi:hypothetical protein